MNYSKIRDKIFIILMAIFAVEAEAEEGENKRRRRYSYINGPGTVNDQNLDTRNRSFNKLSYDPNKNNGALFNSNTLPFTVIDSNGRVTYAKTDEYKNNKYPPFSYNDNNNNNGNIYFSSANTPHFPSLYNRVLKGVPQFAYPDSNLNSLPPDHPYKRQRQLPQEQVSTIPTVQTDESDQGPLAPAPKSLLEQAGWWEYLAILFGDSGDATALRLILHRLTKLAQLQLGEGDAVRVQAATAFLADHFKPLLVDSFRDFVYDPDYTRNSAMWSSDPGFSSIIRRLVDQMDFFGAQQELDRIFGPNTSVAVSFGMRQPEWLRLKLILEQIAWDMKHPHDLIGLWSSTWNLSVPQKLSILAYASNPRGSSPLDLNLPRRDLVLARINLITNGQVPRDLNLLNQESLLDQAHYKYAIQQAAGNLCLRGPNDNQETLDGTTGGSTLNSSASTVQAEGLKKRVRDYCELVNLTPNFNQFCQSSANDSTPIASLLTAADPLFHHKVIGYMNHLERLFWAFIWTGSCQDARESLVTLTNQIKVLAPRDEMIKKGRIVPPGVADSIQVRLEYMQAVQQTCQSNIQLIGSADVARIFSLLNYGFLDKALNEWQRRYSSVAARLQGYPGGSILSGGEGQLLYQQARSVRITLLIYKYPRSVYVPCLSKGLLTRDPGTDLALLNLAESLDANKSSTNTSTRIDPLIPEMSARSLYMRALYLSGRYRESDRIAREIASSPENNDLLVREFLACSQLCGSATRNPCAAEKAFNDLLNSNPQGVQQGSQQDQYDNPSSSSSPPPQQQQQQEQVKPSTAKAVYSTGKILSSRLCRLSRNTASDALSLRYGKVLTTQTTFSALKRYFDMMEIDIYGGGGGGGVKSKLKAGRAQSILPWFGSLPPAPVDEILSFVPTRKLNFVSQVGIDGFPIIQPSPEQQGDTNNANLNSQGNAKIFVLGKEYSSDILTKSNDPGNTQPLVKNLNGMFQLVSKIKDPSGRKDQNTNKDDQGENPSENQSDNQSRDASDDQ
jgi:hypothetical protein